MMYYFENRERTDVDIFVRPGDSLWQFSEVFKIPLQLIVDSNLHINPQILQVGQRIQIPGFVTINYQIQQGNTLWQIAQSRNLPLQAILLVNPNLNPNRMQIGQTIQIPQRITWRLVNGKQDYDYNIMISDLKKTTSSLSIYSKFINWPFCISKRNSRGFNWKWL